MNPYANPMIDTFASLIEAVGTQFGPAIAPFGPAVVQLGADARYFKGS
jgi:hypothetical protein